MPQSDFHHPFNQKNHPCLQFIRAKNSKVTAEQVANDDEFDDSEAKNSTSASTVS